MSHHLRSEVDRFLAVSLSHDDLASSVAHLRRKAHTYLNWLLARPEDPMKTGAMSRG